MIYRRLDADMPWFEGLACKAESSSWMRMVLTLLKSMIYLIWSAVLDSSSICFLCSMFAQS
jgi:hypothetical protein